ncbi:glycoside hydrolase family 16 protein [Vibrio quintilis]|uniref:Glucan endo-1,3-beta-glucosidase A1 n=1 Tax=Vibrio quintilis TaxID=1117707 RepID=A0A1M7YT11_9VIBR|nr:glycoside hydrolase family 16 protein [Vibrio quintilis]SHO55758.1 Glucan endo-1,3-beta-glucosidase A1 precursor [Vibrio quintilis]
MQNKHGSMRNLLGSLVTIALTGGCSHGVGDKQINDNHGTDFTQSKHPVTLVNHPKAPAATWQLVWEDSFDGHSINRRNWSLQENCWGGGNDEQQCYTRSKKNAFVQDGYLHIVARKENFTGPGDAEGKSASDKTLPYTSARLRSLGKREQKYGRFEIRAKLPQGQGTWPAFWMLPSKNQYGTWAASGEIDMMEAVNLKTQSDAAGAKSGTPENRIYGSLHYGKAWPDNVYTGQGVSLPGGISPADGFHTYAIEWEEGEIRWYVDNIHYATQTQDGWYSQYKSNGELVNAKGAAPFNQKFHLLMNLAVGGSWAANANDKGIDATVFPQTLLVDYVKVYRCSVDRWKGKGCATRGDQAIHPEGHQPPAILVQDDSYADGPELNIFSEQLNPALAYGSYNPVKLVSYQEVEEKGHGKVLQLIKQNGAGNLYFRAPVTDLTAWLSQGELIFDLNIESADKQAELLIKTDSGWPKTSDMNVPLPPVGQWQEVRIPLKTLFANTNRYVAGNQADPAAIKNLLVFEPVGGAMTLKLDNIRFQK